MHPERRLAVLFGVVILAAMAAGVLFTPRTKPPAVLVPLSPELQTTGDEQIRPQTARGRTWRTEEFTFLYELGAAPDEPLSDPISVRTDASGHVYVLDWGSRAIRRYGLDGTLQGRFGGRAGQGPGEFANPTDMDVAPDGTVWACDPVNGLITIFDADGTVERSIRTDRPPHRVALLGNGDFVIIPSPAGTHLFHRYDREGRLVDTCGTVVREQERLGVVLDGRCAGTGDGRFAYAGYRAGLLALYDPGRMPRLLFAHTIEHPGVPQIVTRQTGDLQFVRVHPDAPLVSRSVSIVGGDVHVLSGGQSPEKRGIMDVYEHRTGAYVHSYLLPCGAASACRSDGLLFTVADTTVRVWRSTGGVQPVL